MREEEETAIHTQKQGQTHSYTHAEAGRRGENSLQESLAAAVARQAYEQPEKKPPHGRLYAGRLVTRRREAQGQAPCCCPKPWPEQVIIYANQFLLFPFMHGQESRIRMNKVIRLARRRVQTQPFTSKVRRSSPPPVMTHS